MVRIFYIVLIAMAVSLQSYEKNPYVDPAVWDALAPHFLPEDHSIKDQLDLIFAASRVIQSPETIKKAGFKFVRSHSAKRIQVVKHAKMKGYLFKFFTDEQPFGGVWVDFAKRIEGAFHIEQAIKAHGYKELFKVPKKWIYPLPITPSPPLQLLRKDFILVVEDMHILKDKRNTFFWRSVALNKERMDALYLLLQELGLFDSVYPDNIPFCKDGKQAFIDTQHFHGWPIPFEQLMPFLRLEMQLYLEQLSNF